MSLSGVNAVWVFAAIGLISFAGGCVSHDQVHLPNPSPCRVRCHPDFVAPLDPECHGYHPTCWAPWSCNCPPCPPPVAQDCESYPERFEMAPEEVRVPSLPTTPLKRAPSTEQPPELPGEFMPSPTRIDTGDSGASSTIKVRTPTDDDGPPMPPQ